MSVITKKTEKVSEVVGELLDGFTFEQFLTAFQAGFPKDWSKVVREFEKHERKTKPGKSHPMPEPAEYMRNALNVYLSSAGKQA
ncbi:hypothetical protein ACQCP0_23675 [Ralstonia pseudosolanacearum]|uniref:hypothetical protein n=1 Tax=Ralstonia pseudosolanacearum TaxID=1310165 RepID=UPI0002F84F9E|nr:MULTISPECIES: hypothetical protein [Ralstonia]APC67917.1 hypothetical protein RSOE_12295 [Ralstonia solanacearum OE1-1]APF87826.1 hypothetical protein BCR16_13955 [Ralstonia solanacearum FJAT-1458]ARS55422.1 hypothetical protein BC427_04425 [Ralstonia solanacearum FJAT-91]AXV96470.1 hypothetical protein CJO80_13350 [Ralstonia solanacearum]API75454.1 hypothetical protein AC251_13355 [Ralstonia pseudosolanacearum]